MTLSAIWVGFTGPSSLARIRRRLVAALTLAIVMTAANAGAAASSPSVAQEESEGAALFQRFDSGELTCSEASVTDFERVGEYVMGRMIGASSAHESMNELMAGMMGATGEESMHEVMGRRFAGCGSPEWPGGYGGMMGAIGMMGATGGMMGGGFGGSAGFGPGSGGAPPAPQVDPVYGPGSMMGLSSPSERSDDDDDAPVWMIVMMLVVVGIAAALTAWAVRHGSTRRADSDPIVILRTRYARGELDSDDFEQHLRLLGGKP